jgi:hypothetical protein
MKPEQIDQALEGLKLTLKTLSQESSPGIDFKSILKRVNEIVDSIPYGAISGDQVTGGTIKNFNSSGIKDSATKTIVKVTDEQVEIPVIKVPNLKGSVTIEDGLVAKNITVLNDLTVSGVLRANVDVDYGAIIKRIPQRSLSGNLINGGLISNFSSNGIKDEATENKIVVRNDGVILDKLSVKTILGSVSVENNLTAENLNVSGTIKANRLEVAELKADVRLERTTPLEFKAAAGNSIVGKGLLWSGEGVTKQFVLRQDDRIFSTENLDLQKGRSFMIDNIAVVSEQELGPTIRKSRLTELGNLKSLAVLGDVNFNNHVIYNAAAERLGIGIETPNGLFSIGKNNVEIKLDVNDKAQAIIGVHGYNDVNLVTDDAVRLTVHNNGNITLGNKNAQPTQVHVHGKISVSVNSPDPNVDLHVNGPIKFKGQLHTYDDRAPAQGFYNKADIVWNTDPRSGQPVGWVCTRSGTPGDWRPFGIIA